MTPPEHEGIDQGCWFSRLDGKITLSERTAGASRCIDLRALVTQGVLVEQVLRHLVLLGVHTGEVGDVVTQLLDGLHLLIQVVALQEVT